MLKVGGIDLCHNLVCNFAQFFNSIDHRFDWVLSEFSLSPDPVFSALKSVFDVTLVVSRAF